MKYLLIFAIAGYFFCISCKKDKNNEPTPITIIDNPYSWLNAKIGTDFIFKADTNNTTIDTQKMFTEIFSYDIENRILAIGFEGRDTGIYILGKPGSQNYIRFLDENGQIFSSANNSGELHITKYDTVQKRMSGSFSDRLIRIKTPYDSLIVKDGKFDNLRITAFK